MKDSGNGNAGQTLTAAPCSAKKRIPLHERFWAVINFRGEVFPSAISYTRSRAIWRFINDPRAGYGDTWPKWKRAGFKCVRVTISPNSEVSERWRDRKQRQHQERNAPAFARLNG